MLTMVGVTPDSDERLSRLESTPDRGGVCRNVRRSLTSCCNWGSDIATPSFCSGSRKRLLSDSCVALLKSSFPFPGWAKVDSSVDTMVYRVCWRALSSCSSVLMITSLESEGLRVCTSTLPILEARADRIFSTGGGPLNFTYIIAPPLKSIPYLIPPFMAMLVTPATVSTRDAIMNGHL